MQPAKKKKYSLIKKIIDRLYVTHWTVGFFYEDIKHILATRSFDPDIKWFPIKPLYRFYADPFLLKSENDKYFVFAEDFKIKDGYAKISLLSLDKKFNLKFEKVLLETKNSHLSYPFIFEENNKIYVFPEAGKSGKLSCYEYNQEEQTLNFLKILIDAPIVDPTILKHNNKYWLFGTLKGEYSFNKLYLYFSDDLLGPYKEHPQNPIKDSLNSCRPAGNFLKVTDIIYRPSQNCEKEYGESITINKIIKLDEYNFSEEPHMLVAISKKNKCNRNIRSIHTINVVDGIIAVDGKMRRFSPFSVLKDILSKAVSS